MEANAVSSRKRILDTPERMSEILFGLVMVLSFTCSLSAATAGREEVRTVLFAAVGCNTAWAIIDAIMYAMNGLIEKARTITVARAIKEAPDEETARRIIDAEVPPAVAANLDAHAYRQIREKISAADLPPRPRVTREDLLGMVAVFLLVFLSTFPVVLPFVFIQETRPAMRVSNLVAIILLFVMGCRLGPYTGQRAWVLGAAMVGLGLAMVGITLALGG